MKKKYMLIGCTGAGKTTLAENLSFGLAKSKKTQSVEHVSNFIDTPGEFMENPSLYKALLVTSYDADLIVMVQEATEKHSIFPPNFASAFTKEVIGVVTKVDMAEDTEQAKAFLKQAGAKKIFTISSTDEETWESLREYLDQL